MAMEKTPLTGLELSSIADRRRVWEARKFCQVKPTLAQYARDGEEALAESVSGQRHLHNQHKLDAALTALLRGVLYQLSADLVMINLLDDHTQYFVAGATDASRNDASITLESAQWYGCDHVSHHGGLCERTITIKQKTGEPPAMYEVLDMSLHKQTQYLPFVDGTSATFRHYIGSPIKTPGGYNIGTVFSMSKTASTTGTSTAQRDYLHETSKQVMGQLIQAMQALEGRRTARYNEAVTSLLSGQAYKDIKQIHARIPDASQSEIAAGVYEVAAGLLHDFFDLAGLVFQDVPLSSRTIKNPSRKDHNSVLASSLQPGMAAAVPVDVDNVQKLLKIFPQGGVIYANEDETDKAFSGLANGDLSPLEPATNAALSKSFPGARQIVFAPLWDALHSRTTAICFGWVNNDERVFETGNDLPALSSFCMATMSHIQRMESLHLDRIKSDFLGSISHETRSPLHNVLGNLELLLGTNCDDEQREMLVNARFGATQLLGSIDKILQYSKISNQSSSVSTLSAADQLTTPDATDASPDQDQDQVRDNILQIGSLADAEITASRQTDLIGLCEETIEDVAKRMRLSDTILSSNSRRKTPSRMLQSSPQRRPQTSAKGEGDGAGHFSIILFDARSVDNCQIPGSSVVRIILENLLSNALKFTRVDCCVRCSLTLTSNHAEFSVMDCGRGFSPEFVRHSLYVPFTQQNSIDEGVGLGMSLVKRHVEELEGTIQIDSEQTLGTTVTVSLPVQQLIQGTEQPCESEKKGRGGTSVIPPLPNIEDSELPTLKACIYAPSSWVSRYDERDVRAIGLLRDSLRHTLGAWFQPVLSIWQEDEHDEDTEDLPDLIFVVQHDVERFRESSGKKFSNVKTIVICADVGQNSEADYGKIEAASVVADAIITGSVIPSKLWKTVTLFFPHVVPNHADIVEKSLRDLGIQDPGEQERVKELASAPAKDESEERSARMDTPDDDEASGNQDTNAAQSNEDDLAPQRETPRRSPSTAPCTVDVFTVPPVNRSPHILMVDDNIVNLKMLGAFLKKSGVSATDKKSASGGQEAINACEQTSQDRGDSHFDIIFMDLSMPEVTGFDATAAIRRMEDSKASKKAYIVALSGLVSQKDREAAFAAGVDDFITKPAGIKNVQGAIAVWKSRFRTAQPGLENPLPQ